MPHWPWRSAARRSSATRFASGSSWAAAPWSARATTSWPHESNYSRDGSLIYHASIGPVYTPADAPVLDATKGDRWFQVVDARTLRVLRRDRRGEGLAAAGHPGMSSAVRPMVLSPDERYAYLQLSFLHGFVEFDLQHDRPLRIARLPLSETGQLSREQYVLDSAHHGLSMNGAGTKLCGRRHDVRLRGDRRAGQLRPQDRPRRRQALLVDQQRRRHALLRLGEARTASP